MDMSFPPRRKLAEPSPLARIEGLLKSYPSVTASEIAEILEFLQNGPRRDLALLNGNEGLRPKLFQFRHDHATKRTFSLMDCVIVGAIIAGFITLCVLLLDVGAGA